jgi:hypothetical protein
MSQSNTGKIKAAVSDLVPSAYRQRKDNQGRQLGSDKMETEKQFENLQSRPKQ